jgi:hypothetical protein
MTRLERQRRCRDVLQTVADHAGEHPSAARCAQRDWRLFTVRRTQVPFYSAVTGRPSFFFHTGRIRQNCAADFRRAWCTNVRTAGRWWESLLFGSNYNAELDLAKSIRPAKAGAGDEVSMMLRAFAECAERQQFPVGDERSMFWG